ncbi:hypothetical protein EV359DRAFT_63776 [Lentinula novae-zelandiae]|nr:hypothetical protein EV359DRAFT_63776 [Lentinula novae-zelandiae]
MLLFDTPFVHRILDKHPVSQIVSVVSMVIIVWYLYAGDDPLRHRARDIQIAGVLVVLPLGFRFILLYLLFCYVCTIFYAIPPSPPSNDRHGASSVRVLQTAEAPPYRIKKSILPQQVKIRLPVEGWSIDVEFSSSRPHVRFPKYHFDFEKQLDQTLGVINRSGQVFVEYAINPVNISWNTDTFLRFPDDNRQWDARLKVIHKEHRAISIYEFALTHASIRLPIHIIPKQFRKGGADGNAWSIDVPKFADFQNFVKDALAPERSTEDTPLGFSDSGGRRQFNSYIPCVDLTQAYIPIIVPHLKAISIGSDSQYGGTGAGPFLGRKINWTNLTHISFNAVTIFAEDYKAILDCCPELRTFILHRPGEGYGTLGLVCPAKVVRPTQLKTLRLVDCRVDIHGFLSAAAVDLQSVTELVLLCTTAQSIQANELNVDWTGIRTMKLSNTLGEAFIHSCRTMLSINGNLDIITI